MKTHYHTILAKSHHYLVDPVEHIVHSFRDTSVTVRRSDDFHQLMRQMLLGLAQILHRVEEHLDPGVREEVGVKVVYRRSIQQFRAIFANQPEIAQYRLWIINSQSLDDREYE